MEIEMGHCLAALFADEQSIAEEGADLGSYSTVMASQEYEILEDFPDLENMRLSDYTELDKVYRYDPFEPVDTEAMIFGIITAEYIMNTDLSVNGKRTMSEINSDAEENTIKSQRRRTETVRLAKFGWKQLENGYAGKRPRFVYIAPNGDKETSKKKAMAAIRRNVAKDTAACEQLV
jgi:hypothetical protein